MYQELTFMPFERMPRVTPSGVIRGQCSVRISNPDTLTLGTICPPRDRQFRLVTTQTPEAGPCSFCVCRRGLSPVHRFRASMAHKRQSRPDSGHGFQAKVLKTFEGVPASLGSGPVLTGRHRCSFFFFITLQPRVE